MMILADTGIVPCILLTGTVYIQAYPGHPSNLLCLHGQPQPLPGTHRLAPILPVLGEGEQDGECQGEAGAVHGDREGCWGVQDKPVYRQYQSEGYRELYLCQPGSSS